MRADIDNTQPIGIIANIVSILSITLERRLATLWSMMSSISRGERLGHHLLSDSGTRCIA